MKRSRLELLVPLLLCAGLAHSQSSPAYGSLTWSSVCGSQPCGATPTFTMANFFTAVNITLSATTITSSAFSSPVAGVGALVICQDATGGRTNPTLPTSFKNFGAPASTAANACSYYTWEYDGTNVNCTGGNCSTAVGGDLTGSMPSPTVANVNGGTVPTSAAIVGTNSSKQLVAATAHNIIAPYICADSSGSGTAQSCTTSPSFTPATNDCIWYTTTTTNSGTGLTSNVNSLGAKSIAIPGSSGWTTTLTASIIPANKMLLTCYDGTAWNLQQTGTVSSGGTSNCCGLPAAATVGTMIVTSTASNGMNIPFTSGKSGCAATKNIFWPVKGYFVSPAMAITATATAPLSVWPYTSCGNNGTAAVVTGTGLTVLPNSVAGGYVNTFQYDGWHANIGAQIGLLSTTAAGMASATFVGDVNSATTVLGAGNQTALTASSTQFWGFGSPAPNATELNVAIPVPFAGTFQGFAMCNDTNPTATVAVNFRDNGANVGTPGNIGFTIPTAVFVCGSWDSTDSFAASAGDYVDVQTVSGATTQTKMDWMAIGFTPTSGSPEMIWGQIGANPVVTQSYSTPMLTVNSTTITSAEAPVPRACTASNLYVVQAVANGAGVTTTFTLYDNGVATALTGTTTSATTPGAVLVDGTHTVSLAAGDVITMGYSVASGTGGLVGGWAFKCQ